MAALIPLLGAAALYGYYSSNREVELVHATVDGEKYLVLRRADKAAAANLLATVRRDLESLVAHMHEKNQGDGDCTRLHRKFNPSRLERGRSWSRLHLVHRRQRRARRAVHTAGRR